MANTEEPNIDAYLTKTYNKLLKELPNARLYNIALTGVLEDLIEYSIAFEASLHKLKTSNHTDIVRLDESFIWINSIYQKLSKIKLVNCMLSASAMNEHRDHIIGNLIDQLFPTVSTKSKSNVDISELLNGILKANPSSARLAPKERKK